MALLLAACVLREDHVLAPLLSNRVLRRLGTISYGIYLLHIFALHGVFELGIPWAQGPSLPTFALTLLATVAAAEVSYRWFEQPCLRLKSRFAA